MKKHKSKKNETMRAEYDFSRGVRGKYLKRYQAGSNVVVLSPDVYKAFPDSTSVNHALRELLKIARKTAHL